MEPVNSNKSATSQDEKAVLAVNVATCSADKMESTDENKENDVATLTVNLSDILKHCNFNQLIMNALSISILGCQSKWKIQGTFFFSHCIIISMLIYC